MDNFITQKAISVFNSLRDNLLKPMAKEITQKQDENCEKIIKNIIQQQAEATKGKSALEAKITELENLYRQTGNNQADKIIAELSEQIKSLQNNQINLQQDFQKNMGYIKIFLILTVVLQIALAMFLSR